MVNIYKKINTIKEETSSLTEREVEVLKLMVQSKSNAEIADKLIMSVHTAKAHVGNIFTKLEVHDRVGAVVKAIKTNIIKI